MFAIQITNALGDTIKRRTRTFILLYKEVFHATQPWHFLKIGLKSITPLPTSVKNFFRRICPYPLYATSQTGPGAVGTISQDHRPAFTRPIKIQFKVHQFGVRIFG